MTWKKKNPQRHTVWQKTSACLKLPGGSAPCIRFAFYSLKKIHSFRALCFQAEIFTAALGAFIKIFLPLELHEPKAPEITVEY